MFFGFVRPLGHVNFDLTCPGVSGMTQLRGQVGRPLSKILLMVSGRSDPVLVQICGANANANASPPKRC